ncbi:MAG: tetratricopeptide repeat protein [Verrucomicrobia bacterium]|nr:tetratricopeptide repeat protein [Verrucomicrobiota bacterium]
MADYGTEQRKLAAIMFTDMVGSTALKQQLGDTAGLQLIQRHHELLRRTLQQFPGAREIKTAGDSFFLAFATPSAAVSFALLLEVRLRQFNAGSPTPVRDRVGVHLGEVTIEGAAQTLDLHGLSVDLCARVMSLARGGQILLTRAVFDSARQVLKGEDLEGVGQLSWLNHGRYQLQGIDEPVEICEVVETGISAPGPPETSEKAKRHATPDEEPVLGWRPALGQIVPNTKWVLEQKLGEGGFGEVWLGQHQVMKERRVFKFCFRGDRVRSLKREMTLFRLIKERVGDHQNIVALREVYFDQPPFYVEMDYVAGKDLRTWCEAQGGVERVPLEAKLDIVAQVADALQAAHDAGVIHRDVKPANILVSSVAANTSSPLRLQAKLTDFGIGQVVSEEYLAGVTRAGFTQTMMAPSSSPTGTQLYMAPELLAGKPASTRSDIYSLGVVLYQLISGNLSRPLATDWADDVDDSLLREDLRHCFTGKAEDRFAGAAQLAKNLRALPERRAALARQAAERAAWERAAYRRGILRTAAFALVVILVVSLLAATAIHQSRRARQEAATAQRVSDFLIGLFRVSDPGEARGNTITAREILDRGAQRIEQELTNEPLTQAKLMDTMGRVYRSLGLQGQAQPLLEKALRIRRDLLGEDSLEFAQSLTSLANVLWDKADYATARPMFERALAIREKVLGPDDPEVAASCHNLANLFLLQGDHNSARPLYERALVIRERSLGPTHAEVAATLNSLGALEYRLGDPTKAKTLWERSLTIRDQTLGSDHPLLAMTCNNLGLLYKDLGDLPKAKAMLQRAIRIQEKSLGPSHSDLASALHNLGDVLRKANEPEPARLVLERAVRIRENAFGPDHPELARVLFSLAELERETGKYDTAKPLYDRALAIQEKASGNEDSQVGWYVGGLGNLNRDQRRWVQAEQLYQRALRAFEKDRVSDTPAAGEILDNLGKLYQSWGRTAEAAQCYQRALTISEKAYGPSHPDSVLLRGRLAEITNPGQKTSASEPSGQKP